MNPRLTGWIGWTMVGALLGSIALLLTLNSGKVLVSQRGALGGSLVKAEFKNSWPLVAGMSVRVSGAVAGSVQAVKLTDRGTSEVELRLARGVPQPRTDASAAIRQADVLGDTYVALTLGDSPDKLEDPIGLDRTITMPRLDELFSAFPDKERVALKATIESLSTAVDNHGGDLNEAILELRPGIEALTALTGELDNQETDLRAVVTDAQKLTSQLAAGSKEISSSIDDLNTILTTAARHGDALQASIQGAPEAARRTSKLLQRTGETARAGVPLAKQLQASGPELRKTAPLVEPFAKDAAATLKEVSPVLKQLRATLIAAQPVTANLAGIDPVDVLLPAAGLLKVLSPVFGDGAKALFGANTYGKDGKGQTGLGAVAVERGNQPSTPNFDESRTWLRAAGVLTCEMFGRPVQPGCLAEYLSDTGLNVPPAGSQTSLNPSKPADSADAAKDQLMEYLLR